MSKIKKRLQALRYDLPRSYALWRLGVTRDEAYSYNTTDRVLLTFDDFGSAATIRSILSLLKQENVKAAFFLQGNWTNENEDLAQEIADHGHWVGNHSYSHPHLDKLPEEMIRTEIERGPKAQLMRPPYGDYDKRVRKIAAELGYKISFWTIDSWDWRGLKPDEMLGIILPRLHNGACILMHLNAPHTLEMLPDLIAGVRKRGFELCFEGTEIKL